MLNELLNNCWFFFCVFLAGAFNSIMDHYDFRRPHDNGFFSLHTLGSKKDIWHFSKYAMILSFVIGASFLRCDINNWYDYAQIIFWSGITWSVSRTLFYQVILKSLIK